MDVRKEEARDISGMSTDKTVKWQSLKVGGVLSAGIILGWTLDKSPVGNARGGRYQEHCD